MPPLWGLRGIKGCSELTFVERERSKWQLTAYRFTFSAAAPPLWLFCGGFADAEEPYKTQPKV